ncbi:MAG: SCO family protein [Chthoniobacteraceae bacterium]
MKLRRLLSLVVLGSLGFGALQSCQRGGAADDFHYSGQRIPPNTPASDFQLTDQDGNRFSLSAEKGKVVVLFFGFTHCPNICPTTLARLASVVHGLPAGQQRKVQVVFITLDPERDDVAAIKGYVPFFDPSFIGLTGSTTEIAQVAKDYGVSYEKTMQSSQVAANNYTISHSSYTYVVDPAGHFAILYEDKNLLQTDAVTRDLQHLLEEAGS